MANHNLLKQASGGFVTKVAAAGLGFLISVLLARYLGPAQFGEYSIALSISNIIATILTLGLPMLVVRQVSIYENRSDWSLLKGLVQRSYQWPLLATGFVSSIFGVAYFWIPVLHRDVILITLILSPILALNQIRAAMLRGLHWVVLADVPELLARPVLVLLLIGSSIWLTNIVPGTNWAMTIQLGAAIGSFALGMIFLQKRLPKAVTTAPIAHENKKWFFAGATFLGVALVSVIEGQMTLLMLGSMAGTKAAGLFQAAFQLVAPLIFGLLAVNMALQSKLAAAWARGDKPLAQKLVSEAARLGMTVAIVAAALLLIFAEELLALYGPDYVEAATALRIIVAGQLVNAAAGSCGIVLSMTGHQKEVLRGVMLALCVNTALCLVLVPKLGIVGAALAASMGLITWNSFLVLRAKKVLLINTTILGK